MSPGYARSPDHDDAARGFKRNVDRRAAERDAEQFKLLAIQFGHGLIALSERAERSVPGSTGDAIALSRAAVAALTSKAQAWPVVVPKDEEE